MIHPPARRALTSSYAHPIYRYERAGCPGRCEEIVTVGSNFVVSFTFVFCPCIRCSSAHGCVMDARVLKSRHTFCIHALTHLIFLSPLYPCSLCFYSCRSCANLVHWQN